MIGNETILAHRVSYQLFKGPVPTGAKLLNLCGFKRCVNPDHWIISSKEESKIIQGKLDRRKGGGWKPGPRLEYGIKRIYKKKRELDKAFEIAEEGREKAEEKFKKEEEGK